ncbi:MAG: glycosyltransferase [Actinobacteria bacterium]|nr:glycosyltransferase [Actinomycetota bacterium]
MTGSSDGPGPAERPVGTPASVAAVIPAHNEELTVGDVVDAAREAQRVDEVIVVDNRSDDGTARVAAEHGARVVFCATPGKGEAMRAGVRATDKALVVFLDADLVGLRRDHVDALVAAVDDGAAMSCGLFDRGRLLNPLFLHLLPVLTGQRALSRRLFEAVPPEEIRGYRVEAALNEFVRRQGLPVEEFVCPGLWHRQKEQKFPTPLQGFLAKVTMLATAVAVYLSWWRRRR